MTALPLEILIIGSWGKPEKLLLRKQTEKTQWAILKYRYPGIQEVREKTDGTQKTPQMSRCHVWFMMTTLWVWGFRAECITCGIASTLWARMRKGQYNFILGLRLSQEVFWKPAQQWMKKSYRTIRMIGTAPNSRVAFRGCPWKGIVWGNKLELSKNRKYKWARNKVIHISDSYIIQRHRFGSCKS